MPLGYFVRNIILFNLFGNVDEYLEVRIISSLFYIKKCIRKKKKKEKNIIPVNMFDDCSDSSWPQPDVRRYLLF